MRMSAAGARPACNGHIGCSGGCGTRSRGGRTGVKSMIEVVRAHPLSTAGGFHLLRIIRRSMVVWSSGWVFLCPRKKC